MLEVRIVRDLDAPANVLWAVLENFGDISWVPGPEKVEVIGSGVGMTRRIHMAGGMDPFDEILTAIDGKAQTLDYRIPKNAMIPFDDYEATIRLEALAGDRTRLVWASQFDNGATPADQAKAMIEGAYNMMIDALAAKVGA